MPRKQNIDYSKVDLSYIPDEKIRTNSKTDETCIQWTTNSWKHKYVGSFIKECEHGEGTYAWNRDLGRTVYEGKFYANNLHGYGRVSYNDGSIFEGLFKMNLRFGPGVFTYSNGEQDVGIWDSRHLVRLSQIVYPECIPKLGKTRFGKARMLRYRKIIPINETTLEDVNLKTIHANKQIMAKAHILYSDCVRDPKSTFFNKKIFDDKFIDKDIFFIEVIVPDNDHKVKVNESGILSLENSISSLRKDDGITVNKPKTNKIPITDLVAWNNNNFSIQILLHTFLNRDTESNFTPYIGKILAGDRFGFRTPGVLEQHSILYLKCCNDGNVKHLERLIYKHHVYPNVCDAKGNSSVMYAGSRDQHHVLKVLPGFGVDFNQFNDESLTALNVVLLRYISRLNKIQDWEVAFILPLICHPSQLDTGKLFELKLHQSNTKIDSVNTGGETKLHKTLVNSTNILHWAKSESKLLENYNYINIRERYDRLMANKKPCIFMFQPILVDKRPVSEDTLIKKKKKPIKAIIKRKCPVQKPSPTKNKVLTEGENDKTKEVSQVNEWQDVPLEVIEETIMLLLKGGSIPECCQVPLPAIFLGVLSRNCIIVETLLKHKAEPNARTPECIGYLTPLHFIMSLNPCRELLDIANLLLKYGADPNLRASPNHWKQLKMVLRNPNVPENNLGMTPLHLLCIRQDLDTDISGHFLAIAKLLLMNNANPNLLYNGHSPLSLAMLNGRKCMIKALLETGMVNPNQKLAIQIGVPLTLYLNSSYLEILPIEVAMSIMDLITEYGANPLNMVFDNINTLEYVRSDKYEVRPQYGENTRPLPQFIKSSEFITEKVCQQAKETTLSSIDEKKNKNDNRKEKCFFTLETHLHDLANLAIINNIYGKIIQRIYYSIGEPLKANILKSLNTQVILPNFEKATEIFGKMAGVEVILNTDKVKATLEYTLEHDYVELELSEAGSCQGESEHCDTTKQGVKKKQKSIPDAVLPHSFLSKHNLDKLVDNINELSKKHNTLSSAYKIRMYYPEYDPDVSKYFICFECHNRKGTKLFTCPGCTLVKFCSQRCNEKNIARKTIHKCNDLFYNRLLALDEGWAENEQSKSEKPTICPPTDLESPPIHEKCDKLAEALDKYISFMVNIGGEIDFDKLVFPYCAFRDGNLYYRLYGENCFFIENYSLV